MNDQVRCGCNVCCPIVPAGNPVEAEVEYVDATGRKLFAVVTMSEDGSEADVAVFEDQTGVRIEVDDDVREAIVMEAQRC